MSKRASGPPRRPRNPIAKDVRTPKYRPRVVDGQPVEVTGVRNEFLYELDE